MRTISWLHISDLHLRVGREWAQDVVLDEMCRHIEHQRNNDLSFDFVLVTGDIAFSGQAEEYAIAERFFDELQSKSGVDRNYIFCVPGNHDIDRSKQAMAFRGARSELRNQEVVDTFLADKDEYENLLTRQLHFRDFQRSYFAEQRRQWTAEGLAYISTFRIDELSFAVVGLDSAWLAEGGESDHGNLLMSEMQVINAIRNALESDGLPNVVIAMAHHPFHLLQEFDRLRVQNRVERDAHFFHHGHLHQPGTRIAGPVGSNCLTVAAGASYMTRHDFNAYSIVKLNLLDAVRSVKTFFYNPVHGTYSLSRDEEVFPAEIMSASLCSVGELAEAIKRYDPRLDPYAYYLSALMLGQKSDFPIPGNDHPVFATIDVVLSLPYSGLQSLATDLIRFKNLLKVLSGSEHLDQTLTSPGTMLGQYEQIITTECAAVSGLEERLLELDADSQRLAGMDPRKAFLHTNDLFADLTSRGEWHLLNEQAERHLDSEDLPLALQAKRMCALALANEGGIENHRKAIEYYRSLAESVSVEFNDLFNLATLLTDVGEMEEAVSVIFTGIDLFPTHERAFLDIGQTIVGITGDMQLRKRLEEFNRGQA